MSPSGGLGSFVQRQDDPFPAAAPGPLDLGEMLLLRGLILSVIYIYKVVPHS